MAELVYATFPGVASVIGGTCSIGRGVTPGICTLDITPQEQPPAMFGTLVMAWGNAVVSIPDCRIVAGSLRKDSRGWIVGLQIEDWRWRWRYGEIAGRFNRYRDAAGNRQVLASSNPWRPREIAELCFDAVGQKDFDVSAMPDTARPFVDCDQRPNPMQVLDRLAEELGCVIVPKMSGKATVEPMGVGDNLPTGPDSGLTDFAATLDPPEKPDAMAVVGAPVDYEGQWELEPVALETTGASAGKYVPLDEVSYAPSGGWAKDGLTFLSIADPKSREAARASVYRAWRIKIPKDGLEIPGFDGIVSSKVARLDQLIILPRQSTREPQVGDEVPQYRPAWVFGAFNNLSPNQIGDKAYTNEYDDAQPLSDPESDVAKATRWMHGFSIDHEHNVVTLGEPATYTKKDGSGERLPAKLRLWCVLHVRDEYTDEIATYHRQRNYGTKTGTKPGVLHHPEIVAAVVPTYGPGFAVQSLDYRTTEADAEADYYLDAQEKAWQDLRPVEATYSGILPIELDGAISHVVYTFGNSQRATTRIARNSEIKNYITPYRQRQLNARVAAMAATK